MESKSGESPALPADSTPLTQFFKTFAPKKRFRRAKQANIPRGKVPAETVPAHKRPETNERMHGTDRREAPTPEISRPASPSLPPAAWTGAGPPYRSSSGRIRIRNTFSVPEPTAYRSSILRPTSQTISPPETTTNCRRLSGSETLSSISMSLTFFRRPPMPNGTKASPSLQRRTFSG